MTGNTFGQIFRITSFGESHGYGVGIVIDGCPAGLQINEDDIQEELDKRKPGQSAVATQRKEDDKVEIISGVFNGFTTGAPICLLVRNKDAFSEQYEKNKDLLRPGHADFTSFIKYGGFGDYRGGGRFSGRITAGLVMAGAVAKKLLNIIKIETLSHTIEIGGIKADKAELSDIRKNVYKNSVRCADLRAASKMETLIGEVKKEGDSVGGIIEGIILNVPVGLGEPLFDTLEGDIAKALFAIPSVKAVGFGAGFEAAKKRGSENNDEFFFKDKKIITKTNNSGGILGGISNGMPIVVRVAIKPTPSISKQQKTVNIKEMKSADITIGGRHDPCIVPRAVPVIEAMLAVTMCDFCLRATLIPPVIRKQ
jgi:chorismate synthase